jgi:hypothetical protein
VNGKALWEHSGSEIRAEVPARSAVHKRQETHPLVFVKK